MSNRLGGRGKKVDYTSLVVRIPEPIREDVDRLIKEFYRQEDNPAESQRLAVVVSRGDLLDLATSLLGQKKSARVTMTKLLQVIFNDQTISL